MITWIRTSSLRLLLALGLSFALWAFVSFSENPDIRSDPYNLEVEVEGLSPGLVRVDEKGLPQPPLPTVSVTVETDENTLQQVRQADLRAFVNLRNRDSGEHTVPVQVESVNPGLRLSFATPEPETITIRLDNLITETVPIRIDVQGNPPFSFERGNPRISVNGRPDDDVQVTGPQNRVEQVVIASATANIDQLSANYNSSLQLQPLDANGDPVAGVEIIPATANVEIPIRSVVGLKRVPVIGAIEGIPAPGYVVVDIQSDPPLINLTGSSGPLENARQVNTEPIDISGATGTISRTVELFYPEDTSPQEGEPTQATVTVRIEQLALPLQVQLSIPVAVTDADAELAGTATPPVIQVVLSGPTEALAQLDPATLVATVDASGLDPGTYTLQPQLTLPGELADDITIVNIPAVSVTLRLPIQPTPEPTAPPEPEASPTGITPPPTETPTTTDTAVLEERATDDSSATETTPTNTNTIITPPVDVVPEAPFPLDETPTP